MGITCCSEIKRYTINLLHFSCVKNEIEAYTYHEWDQEKLLKKFRYIISF